MANKKEQ